MPVVAVALNGEASLGPDDDEVDPIAHRVELGQHGVAALDEPVVHPLLEQGVERLDPPILVHHA